MEDHGGDLILDDRAGGGAIGRLVFQLGAVAEADDSGARIDPLAWRVTSSS
jgi:hypothetical protein